MMTNGDLEERIFLSYSHLNNGFFSKSYFSDCCLMTEVSFLPCILLYQNKVQIVGSLSISIAAFCANIGKAFPNKYDHQIIISITTNDVLVQNLSYQSISYSY